MPRRVRLSIHPFWGGMVGTTSVAQDIVCKEIVRGLLLLSEKAMLDGSN